MVERLEVPKEEAGGRIPLSLPSLNHIHQRRTAAPRRSTPLRSAPLRAAPRDGAGVAQCTAEEGAAPRGI